MLFCIIAIAVCEGRPIFYVSLRRIGAHAKRIAKFRTMVRDADTFYNRDAVPISGNVRFLNTPNDSPLYTRVGRQIERFGLTELPQLLYVVLGNMCLVGNRPLPENVIGALREVFPNVDERFLTPTGLTGPVQLVGRSEISDEERLMVERMYCRVARATQSWLLDFYVLLNTVFVVLRLRPAFSVAEVIALLTQFGPTDNVSLTSNERVLTPAKAEAVTPHTSGATTVPTVNATKTRVRPCEIPQLLIIEPTVHRDERGFFLESYNRQDLAQLAELNVEFVQDNHSSSQRGVLRGLHYQVRREQGKLIRVVRGTVFDVAVDVRRSSPTFGRAVSVELSADNARIFWVPPGFAHGFLVLSDVADVIYKTTDYYSPADERCLAWNDPALKIVWPLSTTPIVSPKDAAGALLRDAETMP